MKRGSVWQKLLSLTVVLAILISISAPASAAVAQLRSGSIGYLAMGDDMTNGVGLETVKDEDGQPLYVPAYPVLVAQYLYGEDWENAYRLRAGSGYRMEELRYLIDDAYQGDGYTEQFFGKIDTEFERLKKLGTVKAEVRDADYISIGVGVNNFATYIVEQILYYVENGGEVKYDFDLEEFAPAEVEEALRNMKTVVMNQLVAAAPDEMGDALELVEFVAEVSAYAYLSYVTSFHALVEEIYALNPDVKLYILGIYNPVEGEVMTVSNGQRQVKLHIGEYFNGLIELANIYTQLLSPRKYDYTYVDPTRPELLIDVMSNSSLAMEDRVPGALKQKLVTEVDDTAAAMIQEMFAQYGVEKDYDDALDIAYEIFEAETAEKRKKVIYEQINNLAVDEVLTQFEKQLENEDYTDTYGAKIDITRAEIQALLEDLGAAADDAAREAVAIAFVEDLMTKAMVGQTFAGIKIDSQADAYEAIELLEKNSNGDPVAMREAAAQMVMDKILEENPENTLGIQRDDVVVLLERLDKETTQEARKAVIEQWLNEQTIARIAKKVSQYVTGYTEADAAALLAQMDASSTDDDAALAKAHLQEKFRPVMVDAIKEKYEAGGFELVNYTSFEAFVDTINATEDTDDVRVLVRNEVRDAATVAIFNHVTTPVGGMSMSLWSKCTCVNHPENGCAGVNENMIRGVLQDVEKAGTQEQKDAVLHQWLVKNMNGGKEPTGAYKQIFFDPVKNEFQAKITQYEVAVGTAEDKIAEYHDSLNEVSSAFGKYSQLKGQAAATILEKYESSYQGAGETAQSYYQDFLALRASAVNKVINGYNEYQQAVQKGLDSCDQLNETFDKVFSLLCEIAEVEEISLNDLLRVAQKVANSRGSYIGEMVENLIQGDSLAKEDKTVAYLALRYYLADAMMIMPSESGHVTIANQFIKGIKGEPTYSLGGYYAEKVVDKAIDLYGCANAYIDLSKTESGQLDPVINPHKYVALGDAVTSGSALENSELAYPQLVGDALAMSKEDRDGADYIYNYTNGKMRAEELLMLVDDSYNGDEYTADRIGTEYMAGLRQAYQANIADADLITVNVGINNLTTYPLTQTMLAYNGVDTYEMDWARFIGQSRYNKISAGKEVVMDLLLGIVDTAENRIPCLDGVSAYERCERMLNTAAAAMESMLYGLVSYIFTLDDAVERIAQMNPDATIVLVGFYNPLEGTYISVDRSVTVRGKTVDLSDYPINVGALGDRMVNLANRYLAHYVGNIRSDGTAANTGSRLLNVAINDTELFATSDPSVSKNLLDLVDLKDFNIRGKNLTLKVPAYLMETIKSKGSALHPNAAGHAYIADQILDALNFEIYADVIVEDYQKTYGDADPDFTHLIDDLSSLYGIEVTDITRAAGEDVGFYDLTVVYDAEKGYKEIDEEFGQLEIVKRTATVSVAVKNGVVSKVTFENVLDSDKAALQNGLTVTKVNGAYVVECSDEKINQNYALTINVEDEEPVIGQIFYEDFTMTLDGVVYLNYYMSFQGFAEDVDFAKDGGVIIWTGSENPTKAEQMMIGKDHCLAVSGLRQNEKGWSAASNEVYAKNLGDLIFMRPYVEVAEGVYAYGPAKFYSPELYCRDQLKNATLREDTKAVCAALLEYGAAAQLYFDEDTENLVTKDLDLRKYELTFSEDLLDPLKALTAEKDGAKVATLEGVRHNDITFANATLSLEGAIILRVGYNLPADIDLSQGDKAEVLFWTEEAYAAASTLAYSENTYSYKADMEWGSIGDTPCYVAGSDYIVAKALGETVYFSVRVEKKDGTVYKGGINWYSPEMYVSDMLNTSNPELLEVIHAIAVYSEKARLRFQ